MRAAFATFQPSSRILQKGMGFSFPACTTRSLLKAPTKRLHERHPSDPLVGCTMHGWHVRRDSNRGNVLYCKLDKSGVSMELFTCLFRRLPKDVAAHISLLIPHLGGKAYALRSAIVTAVGHLILGAYTETPDDDADAQGNFLAQSWSQTALRCLQHDSDPHIWLPPHS